MSLQLDTRPVASGSVSTPRPRSSNHHVTTEAVHRITALLAAIGLFGVAFASWSTVIAVPWTGAVAVCGFAGGLGLAVGALTLPEDKLAWLDTVLLVVGLSLLAAWATANLYSQPGFGTDEAAFEQYAAHLLIHGHDPYGANLTAALSLYRVPIQYATYLLDGGVAHNLGYPAFPLLVTAAFLAVTGNVQSVVVADVVALAATVVILYVVVPRPWRSLAVLVPIGLPILFGYSVSGVNAIVMAALLAITANRWTKVGSTGKISRGDWTRAVCLGLAVSTDQLAWAVAPFVAIGVYLIRRADLGPRTARRITLRYLAGAAGAFALLNAPFIAWGPRAWWSGVLAPVTQHAIPYGQGVVDLSLFFHVGGGNLAAYSDATALALAALLVIYALLFDKVGRACFVLPSIALFLSTRSLAEYSMTLVAIWVVSLVTTSQTDFDRPPGTRMQEVRRRRGALVLVPAAFLPALIALLVAVATPQPLAITVVSVQTNGQLQAVWQVTANVLNRSTHRLIPRFATNFMGQATGYYHRLSGPTSLAPGQHAVYVLDAPNHGSMPGVTTPFLLQAVTSSPETISSSALFTPQPYTAEIEPSYVNQVLATGRGVTLTVQLRSPFGGDVHVAHVTIALGQVIYGQSALIPAEAVIDGAPEGQTPVYGHTNPAGIATFHIRDFSPQDQPVYFQAWINARSGYPFGYSSIVSVLWK